MTMDCNFGIWTNGVKVFLAVKTDQNTLVLTRPQPWASNETTKAIIGLTYAAIDQKQWDTNGVNILQDLVGHTEVIGPEEDDDDDEGDDEGEGEGEGGDEDEDEDE